MQGLLCGSARFLMAQMANIYVLPWVVHSFARCLVYVRFTHPGATTFHSSDGMPGVFQWVPCRKISFSWPCCTLRPQTYIFVYCSGFTLKARGWSPEESPCPKVLCLFRYWEVKKGLIRDVLTPIPRKSSARSCFMAIGKAHWKSTLKAHAKGCEFELWWNMSGAPTS